MSRTDEEISTPDSILDLSITRLPIVADHPIHTENHSSTSSTSVTDSHALESDEDEEEHGSKRQLCKMVTKHFFDLDFTPFHEHHKEGYTPTKLKRFRIRLGEVLECHWAQLIVITLLVLDMLLVILELLIDTSDASAGALDTLHKVFYGLGIAILAIFLVEIILKIFAFGWLFFTKFFFLFDAVVVIAALVLEIVYATLGQYDTALIYSLLLVLRFWRLVRIVFSVAYSVKIAAHEKEMKLKASFKAKEECMRSEISLLRLIFDEQVKKTAYIGKRLRSLEDGLQQPDENSQFLRRKLTEIHLLLF